MQKTLCKPLGSGKIEIIDDGGNLSSKQKYSKKQKLGEKFIADINAIPYPDKLGKRKSKGIIME